MESMIRLLRADEIECRVAMINERGASLLLYKDARADQKILDETFTPFGWKRTHQIIDGNLYCTVEVWDAQKDQWIAKQDVGTVSFTEKEKGQASDSFKRACVNWGIGRELYTAPFIWIPAGSMKIQKKGEKYVTTDRFEVKSIGYNANREIVSLEIVNASGAVVYQKMEAADKKPPYLVPEDFERLEEELKRTGVELTTVLEEFRPQLVVTYDPDGGYGHPDHIRAHQIVHAAVEEATHRPDRLAWTVTARSELSRTHPSPPAHLRDAEEDELPSVPDSRLTHRVPLDDADYAAKLEALTGHATQLELVRGPEGEPWFLALTNGVLQPVAQVEWFICHDLDDRGGNYVRYTPGTAHLLAGLGEHA